MKNIYFDYAASTPLDAQVFAAMKPYFINDYGNPGSLHSFGQRAIGALDASREAISRAIGAQFRELIFTGSATEANNLALRGAVSYYRHHAAINNTAAALKPRIIISSIEHESVLETARALEKEGAELIFLPVDKNGIVSEKALKEAITPSTIVVSIIYANNEMGTVQPIARCKKIIEEVRGAGAYPLFHIDASQALQFLSCNVQELGVDMMTLSAHKIYGPKGIGALYVRERRFNTSVIDAVVLGGGQEFGLRSGTENIPLVVGFAKAVSIAATMREKEIKRVNALAEFFWKGIQKIDSTAKINGPQQFSLEKKLPNIMNIYFPKRSAEDLIVKCDLTGLAVSAGSACRSRAVESSYVIKALGYSAERARSSIRFSFGRPTTKEELKRALSILKKVLAV